MCDIVAEADPHGYGPGIYHPETVPPLLHPYCQCRRRAVLRPPEEWGTPKRPKPEPKEITEEEAARILAKNTTERSRRRGDTDPTRVRASPVTDRFAESQRERANVYVDAASRRKSAGSAASGAGIALSITSVKYGSRMVDKTREYLERIPEAQLAVLLNRAKKATQYNFSDFESDLVDHAWEFGLTPRDRNAYLRTALKIIEESDSYQVHTWRGTEIQVNFWRGRDRVVVDDAGLIRGCYRYFSDEAVRGIQEKRLWLRTR